MRQTITILNEPLSIPVGCHGILNAEEMCNLAKEYYYVLDRHGNEIEPSYSNGSVRYYADTDE